MPAFLLIALKEHRKGQPRCLEQLLRISFFSLNHFYKSVCSGLCKELNNEKGILFEIIYLGIGLINSISDLTFYAGGRKDQKAGKHLYYRQTLSTEQILPV